MRRWFLGIACCIAFSSAGCSPFKGPSIIVPQTSRLEAIHEEYRREFAHSFLPGTATGEGNAAAGGPLCTPQDDAFTETLRDIRAYRVDFKNDPNCAEKKDSNTCDPIGSQQTLAHLDVLEGMIYLQSGRPGFASLLQPQIQQDRAQLVSAGREDGAGTYTRDFIFADNFEDLIDGWSTICGWGASGRATVLADKDSRLASEPARHIGERLTQYQREKRLASGDADEGAVYLATTAAIFDVWAYKVEHEKCATNQPDCDPAHTKKFFEHGRDLIGAHLSDVERQMPGDAVVAQSPPGRMRYILWYRFLADRAAKAEAGGAP